MEAASWTDSEREEMEERQGSIALGVVDVSASIWCWRAVRSGGWLGLRRGL